MIYKHSEEFTMRSFLEFCDIFKSIDQAGKGNVRTKNLFQKSQSNKY
jgi:hypothetical protein